MKKRFIALFLVLMMLLQLAPAAVLSEETPAPTTVPYSGGIGSNVVSGKDYATVTFIAFDGTELSTLNVQLGQPIGELPEVPAREGCNIIGWKTEAGEKVTKDTVVKADMKVIASYYNYAYPALIGELKDNDEMYVKVVAPEGALPDGAYVRMETVPLTAAQKSAIAEKMGADTEEISAVDIYFIYGAEKFKPIIPVTVTITLKNKPVEPVSVVHLTDDGQAEVVATGITEQAFDFEAKSFSVYAVVGGTELHSDDQNMITIRYVAGEGGSVSPASETVNVSGTAYVWNGSTATAATGYRFINWTDPDGNVVSPDAHFKPSITGNLDTGSATDNSVTFQANFQKLYKVEFDPNTEEGGELAKQTIYVVPGEKIGDQLPAVPEVPGYTTKWVTGDGTEITADTVVNADIADVVVGKEKIVYTVTFVQEDGTTVTRRTDLDNGFAINDLPEVTPKTNQVGKWVYPGTTQEFTVGTIVNEDLTVNAAYEQNIFTVEFLVDGAHYDATTTATGTTIILPTPPIKDGATFKGWFTEPGGQGTQYTAESTVSKDLTLYACFEGQVAVRFIVEYDDGHQEIKSQYFLDSGDAIQTIPDDPFIAGKVFDHWENPNTEEPVTVGYEVTESFDAIAKFNVINTYELTLIYFYMNGDRRVEFGKQVYDLVAGDFDGSGNKSFPVPGYTIAYEITEDPPTYYPSQPTITVNIDDFTQENGKYVLIKEDEYRAADAAYNVGHYLKALSVNEYELIETVPKVGVKGSVVTPEINNYAFADYESRDENVELTGIADQELKVKYTRRDFTLSYNVGEGEYINAVTAPYGTTITLPATATRAGYTFAGWYKNEACTDPAGTSFKLEENKTLYAKWNPAQVDYKIVYMVENANDDGYSYLATVTKQAATDSSITMTAQTAGANGTRPSELDTTNFTFKDSTTETVKADGTTVVTVRYSRNVYTLQGRTGTGNNASNIQGATVTAKYGADITQAWTDHFNNRSGSWSYDNKNNSKFKSLTIMPSLSVRKYGSGNTIYVFNHSDNADYYQHLEYWLQNYTGPGITTTTYDGKTYGRVKSIDMRYNFLSDKDDWYDITGYTKTGYTAERRRNNQSQWIEFEYTWNTYFYDYYYSSYYTYTRFNFYYDAEEFPLTFYNYDGTLLSTQQVTLGNNIYSYLTSNIPEAPMEGATWLGWYTDQQHTSGNEYTYDRNTKMPAGLVLYGAFQFPTRTVTFDSQGGTAVASETDEYGFYAKKPDDPTREHFTFQGWYNGTDETATPYDWNQPVTENITLYARWQQDTIGYTVHYYQTGTTTSLLPDKVISDPTFTEGQEITETAPTVAGHVADKASVTQNLSFNEEENTIIFYYYEIPDNLTYTVHYVLKDHPDIKVHESKTVKVHGSTTIAMEKAVEVDSAYLATQTSDADILGKHYKPTENTKELPLALKDNVITFEYVPFTSTKITVNYLDMDGNQIHDTDVSYVEKGDTYTLHNKAPEGYTYHHAYLDGSTTAPQATYQITGNEGDLTINVYYQRNLIILANNKAKTYDGTPISSSFTNASDYTVTGALRGDTLTSLAFDGSQTDAGTSSTTPKNAQISKGAQAITDPETYYHIIYVPGSLTVKPCSVYINVNADQWDQHSGSGGGPNYYTGQVFNVGFTNPNKSHFNDPGTTGSAYVNITSGQRALFKEKYGAAIWNALYGTNGALISEKDAGTYRVTGDQIKANVNGVTVNGQAMMADPNYSIRLYARDSFLVIEPLPLNVTTGTEEKPYDGEPLTKAEGAQIDYNYWTKNIEGTWTSASVTPGEPTQLGTGDTITFNVTGKQTEPGVSNNTYEIVWGDTKSSNYKINENLGTLTVTRPNLTVKIYGYTGSVWYTGEEQSVTGYSIVAKYADGTDARYSTDDFTFSGTDVAKGIIPGTYNMGLLASQFINTSTLYGNVTFEVVEDGKLEIKQPTLTITKHVEGNAAETDKEFPFTMKVNGEAVTYAWTKTTPATTEGGQATTVTDSGNFELKHNQFIVINVPVGKTITLTESGNGNYNVEWTGDASSTDSSPSTATVTATDDKPHPEVIVTNTRKTVDVTVTKIFAFEQEYTPSTRDVIPTNYQISYTYSAGTTPTEKNPLDFSNTTGYTTVGYEYYWTIKDVPVGINLTLTESNYGIDKYNVTPEANHNGIKDTSIESTETTAKTVYTVINDADLPSGQSQQNVTFTNDYKRKKETITITKKFIGLENPKSDLRSFEISYTGGGTSHDPLNYNNAVNRDPERVVDDTGAVTYTFEWKVEGLVGEQYKFTEKNYSTYQISDKYKITTTPENHEKEVDVAEAEPNKAEFVNKYELGSITIKKQVVDGEGITLPAGSDQNYQFKILDEYNEQFGNLVTVKGNDEDGTTVKNVPFGTYKIVEVDPAQTLEGSYMLTGDPVYDPTTATVNLDKDDAISATVTVTNTYTKVVDLTLQKFVTGNLGDPNEYFNFTVKLTGITKAQSDLIELVKGTEEPKKMTWTETSKTATATIQLKHGETYNLTNLPVGASMTITENLEAGSIYHTYVGTEKKEGEITDSTTTWTGSVHDTTEEKNIAFTNYANIVIPTGIALDSAPYLFLMAIALLGVGLMIRRRRKENG